MTPKVTVLLAVHDGERYIRQSVDSILGQTFRDFEFLIVDDASRDATPSLLAAYDDPRIRVLRNETNLGQVPSLNRGLREARGAYVARIDADDWCRPERLARQVEVLDGNAAVGLVGTWMDLVDARDRPIAALRSTIEDFTEFLFHTLIMRVLISHPSALYRREPVLRIGGYDEATGPAEDKDLWRRLVLERWDARIVPAPLVVYRLHEGQLSQTQAEHQRRVDGESQERFLAALAPNVPPRGLRLLLAHDDELWGERRAPSPADVERLLEGATARLRLNEAECARVRELVARRVLAMARTRPWRADARTLSTFALAWLPTAARSRARAATALAAGVAPLRLATRTAARAAGATAKRVPVLRAVHAPASRSRLARRLYGKLVGSS
jgi:GT2 family glycosyltransferase